MAKKDNIYKLPKRLHDIQAKINGKDVNFNFGLAFSMSVQNYNAGIVEDPVSVTAGALVDGDLQTLTDLIGFATQHADGVSQDGIEEYLIKVANENKLEELFDNFFDNLLVNPFLKQSMKLRKENLLLSIQAVKNQNELEKELIELQMTKAEQDFKVEKEKLLKELEDNKTE